MLSDFHRTNLNLRREDVEWLQKTYGYGWTEKVRDIVHGYIIGLKSVTICIHCDGTGRIDGPKKTCYACNGTGRFINAQ